MKTELTNILIKCLKLYFNIEILFLVMECYYMYDAVEYHMLLRKIICVI